ncbi:hypothetical protein MSAN_02478000 [Mycena sanguinolenta]|uniref:DUF7704 domain-containing protein n=1 Tax=Mycena sanguinolenta TaxID=230812 RepID=A0A8H6U458_9AGAR|nr:hypothetical protein MSAN_02478000 [Mycena sanguinolenta]
MATFMPPIPRVFFCFIEPALCLFGAAQPLLNPAAITALLPAHLAGRPDPTAAPTPLETLQVLMTSVMMYGWALLTLAIMFLSDGKTTRSRRLVHAYIAISASMDFPHWGAFAYALGAEGIKQWRTFPAEMWMQVLVPLLTFAVKAGYLAGAFGEDKVVAEGENVDRKRK